MQTCSISLQYSTDNNDMAGIAYTDISEKRSTTVYNISSYCFYNELILGRPFAKIISCLEKL